MKFRTWFPAMVLALSLTGLNAQTQDNPPAAQPKPATPAPSPAPAAREMPPDLKAYNEASRITDPAKKIEALEKFRKDFPDSSMASVAEMAILSTLVKKMPDQKQRIESFAKTAYRNAAAKDQGRIATQIADTFLSGDLLLDQAKSYARIGVEDMRLASYIQQQNASYATRKQKPPFAGELEKRFKLSRASRLSTLGRIEWKLGHASAARRLLEQAYADNPALTVAAASLGEIAAKRGDDAKALEYLIPARLSGRAPESANAALTSVYSKKHNGSTEGLDTLLDAEYRKRYPNPLHEEAYKPSANRADRLVLAEVFTGSGCPPCVAADLAFDAALERYSRKELAVVMYHEHIPAPDPMTNPDTQTRAKSNTVGGVPTFQIDGKKTVGGGGRENTRNVYDRFRPDLEKELDTPAEARVNLNASLSGNTVKVSVGVDQVKSESKDLKLQVALVEKSLRYSGENGVRFHPMVVRAMGGEKAEGFAVKAGGSNDFNETFDLAKVSAALKAHLDDYESKGHRGESFKFMEKKYAIDRGNLAVVAFVQDDKTKHVLQSAWIDLSSPGSHPTTEANNEPK